MAKTIELQIFEQYAKGASVNDVARKLKLTYTRVSNHYYDWDKQKETTKKEVQSQRPMQPYLDFDRQETSNFVLMTNNEAVMSAYYKMVNR